MRGAIEARLIVITARHSTEELSKAEYLLTSVFEALRMTEADQGSFCKTMEYVRAVSIALEPPHPMQRARIRVAVEDFYKRRAREE